MRTPRYGITRTKTGWMKRICGAPKWIASLKTCPTPASADAFFEKHFGKLTQPAPIRSGESLRAMANQFVDWKESARLNPQTVSDYEDTCRRILKAMGANTEPERLTADDAAAFVRDLAGLGAKRRQKHIANARHFFAWMNRAVRTAITREHFPAVTKLELRRDRARRRRRPYTANEIRRFLRHGTDGQRAAVLIAINFAMGPHEIAAVRADDVRGDWFDRPRAKNGIERLIPVWAETRASVRAARVPASSASIMRAFDRLCSRTCAPHFGIYNLRRTFRTAADDFGDQRAAAKVMGRELPDIDSIYVLNVAKPRIVGMMDHVRQCLQIDRAWKAGRVSPVRSRLADRVELRKSSRAKRQSRRGRTGKRGRDAGME